MKKEIITFTLIAALNINNAYSNDELDHSLHNHHNTHNHSVSSPIGTMGTHNHAQGEWMATYKYNTMVMKGNRSGTTRLMPTQVHDDFMVSPLKMTMQMHMLSLMYGISDKLTIMSMLPYKYISMDHVTRMDVNFTTKSEGVGDIKLASVYNLHEHNNSKFLINAGFSLPTGSIDERGDTPSGSNQKLPYPMQLGSGTYDLLPGITYTDSNGQWSWGSQLSATIRIGKNDNNYSLGDQYSITTWGAKQINDKLNTSLRLDAKKWFDINGSDSDLNPAMTPTARADLRAGQQIDLFLGMEFKPNKTSNNIFLIEAGLPIYQKLDGPQLETDYKLTLGWQMLF